MDCRDKEKELEKLLNDYAWNSLQIQQLRIAVKHNVTLEYFSPQYDWEQLREIRLALEDGLDPSFLLDTHIDSNAMKKAREKVYKCTGLYEEARKHKRQKRLISASIFLGILLVVVLIGLWKKDYILSMIYDIDLELTTQKLELGLSQVDDFNYSDLVKSYSDDCTLMLPSNKINGVGEYNLIYTVKSESKSIDKNVILIVKDDIAPQLIIDKDIINVEYGKSVDFKSNIRSCVDNLDGDIKDQVQIKHSVNTLKQGKYEVVYTVEDHAKNKAIQKATINVLPKKEEYSPLPSPTPSSPSSPSSKPSKPSRPSQVPVVAKSKIFYFKDHGGDAQATENFAISYGQSVLNSHKANRFNSRPYYDENGICIGYQVTFK